MMDGKQKRKEPELWVPEHLVVARGLKHIHLHELPRKYADVVSSVNTMIEDLMKHYIVKPTK